MQIKLEALKESIVLCCDDQVKSGVKTILIQHWSHLIDSFICLCYTYTREEVKIGLVDACKRLNKL